ncbi:MAG: hypothetical protein JW893_06560 [Candidatus Omnitrophica bacterium]|nr:hypothetical protein [Candidatus Omnitrophota bacterium]
MKNEESGFTLVEVVFTVCIVVVALLGIMSANTTAERSSEAAFEKSLAAQDANRVIELLRDAANTGSSPAFQTDVQNAESAAIAAAASMPAGLNESITVNYDDVSADPLDITVTVSWDMNGVRTVSIALRTLLTKRT